MFFKEKFFMGKAPKFKPSLQRIEDARTAIKQQIAEERAFSAPRQEFLDKLRKEKLQMKDLLNHLQIPNRFVIKEEYVHNMMDSVLELLRRYLQDELNAMLRGGKNESNSRYIRVRNELGVVLAEQKRRAAVNGDVRVKQVVAVD
ncbi:MAG: hypothetical protein RLZZ480_158 [Candidatus Parcubacteria bacterium]|jgi:uncharacterized protein YdcH (DUF465 family)